MTTPHTTTPSHDAILDLWYDEYSHEDPMEIVLYVDYDETKITLSRDAVDRMNTAFGTLLDISDTVQVDLDDYRLSAVAVGDGTYRMHLTGGGVDVRGVMRHATMNRFVRDMNYLFYEMYQWKTESQAQIGRSDWNS